jgi:3-methyladenine DNA glycosylase AlkC
MIDDVREIIKRGWINPNHVFLEIRQLAIDPDWKKREDAATALVEIARKRENEVINEMLKWAKSSDLNIRRASSEGLRGIARKSPNRIIPILEMLKSDESLYVRKSVAALLRAISKKHPEFVINLCRKWICLKDKNTDWIIKHGLQKLIESNSKAAKEIVRFFEKND